MIRARYDNDGNIILEQQMPDDRSGSSDQRTQILNETRSSAWTMLPDSPKAKSAPVISEKKLTQAADPVVSKPHQKKSPSYRSFHASIAETEVQYAVTMKNAAAEMTVATREIRNLPKRLHQGMTRFWKAASTPVNLKRRAGSRPPTKLQMFALDTVRFGGTFALIFGVLFVGINYQSFFQIARAELALGNDTKTEEALQNMTTESPTASLSAFSAAKAHGSSDILALLPTVGPYEDRLIIPKLGKNVPIVIPSMNALMKQDWKQFEDDIQTALHDGVVHYPGSARPGQAGNFFVTGHSSYYPWGDGHYKDVFARLSELDPGDTYSVYYGGDKHTYRVTKKYEVKPSDVSVLDQPTNKRIATLMTCTPVGTTLRRLIVQAEEIDPVTGQVLSVGEKTDDQVNTAITRLEALPI